MKKNSEFLHQMLKLRVQDTNEFMDKLYDMLTSESMDEIKNKIFYLEESPWVFNSMIKHFEEKEEYEKCDVLLHLINFTTSLKLISLTQSKS